MRRTLAATVAAALILAGCTAATTKPIVINRAQLVQTGTVTLAAIEAGVEAYNAKQPLSPSLLADLKAADVKAHATLAAMSTVDATNLPTLAQDAAAQLVAVSVMLPPGAIPPAAEAGLLAFAAVVNVIAQTAPTAIPAGMAAPVAGASAAPLPASVVTN
jgi:hypothetical protein